MRKAEIRVERVDTFFERGRKLAKAADREGRCRSRLNSTKVADLGQHNPAGLPG